MTSLSVPHLHIVGPLGRVVEVETYARIATSAAGAGRCAVHVRMPGAQGGEILDAVERLRASLTSESDAVLIVNDRADVARLAGADGLHLGERSLPVTAARSLLVPGTLVGRSVHDVEGALSAQAAGADFLFAGHVYATDSKQGQPGRGLDWLASICAAVATPVVAIGGVRVDRVPAVLASGAWGVAVGREVLEASNPQQASAALLAAIERK